MRERERTTFLGSERATASEAEETEDETKETLLHFIKPGDVTFVSLHTHSERGRDTLEARQTRRAYTCEEAATHREGARETTKREN